MLGAIPLNTETSKQEIAGQADNNVLQPVNGQAKAGLKGNKKTVILLLLGVVLVVSAIVAVVIIVNRSQKSPAETAAEQQAAAKREEIAKSAYADLSAADAEQKIKTETGLTKEQLSNSQVKDGSFTEFTKAYNTAKAYFGIAQYDKAVAAYAQADKLKPTSVTYLFYVDYASAAEGVENEKLAIEQLNKALDAISSSSLSEAEKQTLTDGLRQKIKLKALEANS